MAALGGGAAANAERLMGRDRSSCSLLSGSHITHLCRQSSLLLLSVVGSVSLHTCLPCYALLCLALSCSGLPCLALHCLSLTCLALLCLGLPCPAPSGGMETPDAPTQPDVVFKNLGPDPLELLWIEEGGAAHLVATVAAGKTTRLACHTYLHSCFSCPFLPCPPV